MKGRTFLRQAFLAFMALSDAPTATAHSWVEQLQRIASNGTMLTPLGYQRGYVGRGDAGFKGDISDDLWQLPANALGKTSISKTDSICSPQQSTSNYTSKYPKLVTAPGDYIAMRHQENGHVTLPATQQNKPRNRGTIYIYGTDQSSSQDTLASIHKVWNVAGTGGNGKGRLLATRNYDDGQCYQVNSGAISSSRQKQFSKVASGSEGADLWCQSDIQLPANLTTSSNYTLYWVWDWPTLNKANAMPGESGVKVTKQEIYTSCMDLQVVDPCSEQLGDVKSPACSSSTKTNIITSFNKKQSYSSAAVPQELTGNFAVSVGDVSADSSSNDGMSAPPNLATGGAATSAGAAVGTASASTFQTLTTAASTVGGAQTVTVAMSTVTVTQGVTTVTVAAGASTGSANVVAEASNGELSIPRTQGVAPSVKPFSRRRRSRIENPN